MRHRRVVTIGGLIVVVACATAASTQAQNPRFGRSEDRVGTSPRVLKPRMLD